MDNDKFKYLDSAIDYVGYWISPSGIIIGIESDPFKTVWSHPLAFGMNRDNMEELYNKYKDESDTINEIIYDLLDKSWAFTVKKQKYWNLEIAHLNRRISDRIWEWTYNMLNGTLSEEDINTQVKIYIIDEKKSIKTSFSEILTGDFVIGHSSLSAKIQRFIDRNLDYFLDEYVENRGDK